MPKKKKVNGFFLFMRDFMAKEERKGRKISMAQAQNEAGGIWTRMTDQEKGAYNSKAKSDNFKPQEAEKYSSQGVPLSLIEKQRREKDTEERLMKKHIEDTVNMNFINNTLAEQKYYFIMVNYFTKNNEGSIYLPAEIALSEYTIKDGITNRFHSFINPGVGMFGHAYATLAHSEATHKLPVPPNAFGEKKLEKIYKRILEFIQSDDNTQIYPPVYTHKESIPIVKAVLNYLNCAGDVEYPELKVYPMHYLFFTLKKKTAEIGENLQPASIHITDTILDRDKYEYERDISCDFHEKNDNGKYCTLSCVIRWTFTFSENLCNDLAIQMIPGRHVPQNTIQMQPFNMNSSLKDDHSDVRSNYSGINSTDYDICKPKLECDVWNKLTNSTMSKEHFPVLGPKRYKQKEVNETMSDMYSNNSDFDDDKSNITQQKSDGENPWATRSLRKARTPHEDSFNFDNVVAGRGRGLFPTENNPKPSTSSLRGLGRGQFFMK